MSSFDDDEDEDEEELLEFCIKMICIRQRKMEEYGEEKLTREKLTRENIVLIARSGVYIQYFKANESVRGRGRAHGHGIIRLPQHDTDTVTAMRGPFHSHT